MNTPIGDNIVKFSADFSSAEKPDGEIIKFTKSETRAISYLSGLPGKVVTRNQLLDAVSEPGSDKSDRSVDFLINRIRRKIGDDAKNPRFIASRYGEGYTWLTEPSTFQIDAPKVFIVVGPLRWPAGKPGLEKVAIDFADQLAEGLSDHALPDQKIVKNADFDRESVGGTAKPEFMIEITVISTGDVVEIITTTKEFTQARLLDAHRFKAESASQNSLSGPQLHDDFAPDLLAKIWRDKATKPSDIPLQVAMHDVVPSNDNGELSWDEANNRLEKLRKLHPEDAELKIMNAAHLHTKYVVLGPKLFTAGTDTCEKDEATIEKLVLEALPSIEGNPEMMAVAAKLLHFLKKGYENRAIDLAEGAHQDSMNIASTLAIVGQMRCFRGDFVGAKECLEQAKMFAKKGSEFHIYVLVLLIQLHLASDDREGVNATKTEMYSAKPATMIFFEALVTDPEKPSLRARAAIMMLTRKRAQGILKHSFYISGSLFDNELHRENMMRALATLMRRRFGREIFTDKMRELIPNLTG